MTLRDMKDDVERLAARLANEIREKSEVLTEEFAFRISAYRQLSLFSR